jgi:hypothetical protein
MANLKITPSKLTPKRKNFVKAFLATGGKNGKQAAIMAGYSDKGNCAAAIAYQLLHDPTVLAEIRQESDRKLRAGVALGAATLEELAGKANSESVRLQAAVALLDRGGMQLVSRSEQHVIVKDERTDDELRARVAQLQRELGLSAKVIQAEIIPPRTLPAPAQTIDTTEDIFQ